MPRIKRNLLVLLAAALAGCNTPAPNPHLTQLVIATRIGPTNVCSQGLSPAIAVRGAPAGTASYRVRMNSLDVLIQRPWEQTVASDGGDIAEGAAPSFPPPCLSEDQALRYRFEVMALDAGGRALAYGQTIVLARAPGRLDGSTSPAPVLSAPGRSSSRPTADPGVQREETPEAFRGLSSRFVRPPPVPSAPVTVP